MESIPFFGITILLFFLAMKYLEMIDGDRKRKYELEKLRIEKSQRFIAAPMAINLLKEIKENKIETNEENKNILISNLNLMIVNFESNQPDYAQLKDARNKLVYLLKNGNLVTELVIKIEQLLNVLQ